jgi:hypothetical protein
MDAIREQAYRRYKKERGIGYVEAYLNEAAPGSEEAAAFLAEIKKSHCARPRKLGIGFLIFGRMFCFGSCVITLLIGHGGPAMYYTLYGFTIACIALMGTGYNLGF